MSRPRDAARTGRSHGTPATSTALVLTIVSLGGTALHGMIFDDWTPLGVVAVAAWAVFLLALSADMARVGGDP